MTRPTAVLLGGLLSVMMSSVLLSSDAVSRDTSLVQCATERHIVMNLSDVDIRQLITFMSDLTGKIFLVHKAVRGTITLMVPTPLSCDDAYQAFLAVLHSRGFTAIAQGVIIKIVPARKAKASPIPYRE